MKVIKCIESNKFNLLDDLNQNNTHLADILIKKPIETIYVYNDVNDIHLISYDNESIDEDLDDINTSDYDLLSYPDKLLKLLSDDRVAKITNLLLIDKLIKLGLEDKLTDELTNNIQNEYSKKYVISKEDIVSLLQNLKSCDCLFMTPIHDNNCLLHLHDLYIDECLEILSKLELSNYVSNNNDDIYDYLNHNVITFKLFNIRLSDGRDLGNILVQIVLDLDLSYNTNMSEAAIVIKSINEENMKVIKNSKKVEDFEHPLDKVIKDDKIAELNSRIDELGAKLDIMLEKEDYDRDEFDRLASIQAELIRERMSLQR